MQRVSGNLNLFALILLQIMVIILGMITLLEKVTVQWIIAKLGMVTILIMVAIIRDGDHQKGW